MQTNVELFLADHNRVELSYCIRNSTTRVPHALIIPHADRKRVSLAIRRIKQIMNSVMLTEDTDKPILISRRCVTAGASWLLQNYAFNSRLIT